MVTVGARTHFSVGQSLLSPSDYARIAREGDYKCAVLSDTSTISGMVEFVKACGDDIKPVIGTRLMVVDDIMVRKVEKGQRPNEFWYPRILVKNEAGMRDLLELMSLANSESYFYYNPRIGLKDLMDYMDRGNLVVTGGDFYALQYHSEYADIAATLASRYSASQFVLEYVPISTALYSKQNEVAYNLALEHGFKTIISRPVLYESKDKAHSLDVLRAITDNAQISNGRALKHGFRNYVPFSAEEIREEVTRTVRSERSRRKATKDYAYWLIESYNYTKSSFADLFDYKWAKRNISLPKMADDEFKELVELCKVGWEKLIKKEVMGYAPDKSLYPQYKERLRMELETLKRMGFCGYFLLVADICNWSRSNGIGVGPGRGSVGGSLVAYLVGITTVDPIRFGLIFERFINPDRLDLPDADLDFMSSRRHEVIEYLVDKYGEDCVAGISNYNMILAASAIRDVGRVTGMSEDQTRCSKQVPREQGVSATLDEAAEAIPDIAKFRDKHKDAWSIAKNIEGRIRSFGRHAAGVVVAGEPISSRAVYERRQGSPVVNWDKRTVEDWGLVKMDILGLSTLDIIQKAIDYIHEWSGMPKINMLDVPLDDPEIYKAFGRGDSIGVFQFESSGMRNLLKSLDVTESGDLTFDDITAATALFRPGPMQSGLMDQYVNIKQGVAPIEYDHPAMKPALEETYGVIVYQEQVMKVARDLAGFTFAESDHLRKAMGKKDPVAMKKMTEKFVEGAVSHSGMPRKQAEELFHKIEKFAGYGFNKSHAVEYTIISYWSMWLKTYHPLAFTAAALSVMKEEKLDAIVRDAFNKKIAVRPPDINVSTNDFVPDAEGNLITPFNRLKGLSDKTGEAIIKCREKLGGAFKSVDDLINNVAARQCNKRHIEVLDKVGAFAEIVPGSKPVDDESRLRDQMILMPGLIAKPIRAERDIEMSKKDKRDLLDILNKITKCEACDLCLEGKALPSMGGKTLKYMVVFDKPTWSETDEGKMLVGKSTTDIRRAMKKAGLSASNGYFTSLVRGKKSGSLSTKEIMACSDYLEHEIALLRPPVILCMGTTSIRALCPDVKGTWSDLLGSSIYDPKRDATILFGFSPGMLYHKPELSEELDGLLARLVDLTAEETVTGD